MNSKSSPKDQEGSEHGVGGDMGGVDEKGKNHLA